MDTAGIYRGPLEDFVARRTALVRELRGTDPDAAAVAGKLRKPPAGVWAIDQLAAENQPLLNELLAAGTDTREVQESVAAGTGSREDLLLATGRLRDAVDAAARAALDLSRQAGHAASDETARRIRITLQAGATGRAAERQALWTGSLDRDLDVAGFGATGEPDDDSAELAAILAPLRRTPSHKRRPAKQREARTTVEVVAQRGAQRSAAHLDAAAERRRAAAATARHEADRLAEEAREAAAKASAAEQAADAF